MSESGGPSFLSRLFTKVVVVVGVVAALWFGIHLAAQQPGGGGARQLGSSSPWKAADPAAEARGVIVRK